MQTPWSFKICAINVNGIKTNMWTKLRQLHKAKLDIVLLQETKLMGEDLNDDLKYRWRQITNGEAYSEPAASSQAGGVAILLSAYACSILTERETVTSPTDAHRHILLKAMLLNQPVYIHSIYAPVRRNERPPFFNRLMASAHPGDHLIGGDFNCIMNAELYTSGDPTIATSGTMELTGWMASLGATDVWRQCNGERKEYTSPAGTSRIDMIFASGRLANNLTAKHNPRTIGSDHLCPQITSSSSNLPTTGGHWQLPTWLARAAATRIQPILQRLTTLTDNPEYPNLFDRALLEITGKCQATHKQILRWRKEKEERAKLRWLRAHLRATRSPTEDHIADAEAARQAWIRENANKERIARQRAFDKHFEKAERCTRFFLNRPKPCRSTTIPGVATANGTITTDQKSIQEAHVNFWRKLYSASSENTETTPTDQNIENLLSVPIPKLTPAAAASLECAITEDDIVRQINKLANNKAAGTDGLRAELFKQAPTLWARALLPIFEKFLHEGYPLPTRMRESAIVLIYKKGSATHPGNYRPIALLNVIAKILSATHNERLRKVLDKIVPQEQTGFIPGRSISENLILLQDSIHYSKRHNPSSIILSLDFEKAFDRIQWRVMMAILKHMNFGQRWRSVIAAMYNSRRASLRINGIQTNTFAIERGVLQGEPLSPALFILTCSPLYARLEQMKHLHGIPLPNNQRAPTASFYADDTNLLAKSPQSAVQLYNAAMWFCKNSGAKLHPGKCIAIPTGPAPPTLSNGIRVLAQHEHTTILGVPMGPAITRQEQTRSVISKMLDRCTSWAHVGRTIERKVTVARTIILPTIWYVMGVLPTLPSETKKIQIAINNYLHGKASNDWEAPPARGNIASEWFYKPKRNGGWGLTPIHRTMRARKLSLIRSFLNDRDRGITKPWHTFVTHMLREHMKHWSEEWRDILLWHDHQNGDEPGMGDWSAISPWWRDAWREWIRLECTPPRNSILRTDLCKWPIWNNRILATNHGIPSTLHRIFSNSTTRSYMSTIRKYGFHTFRDCMNPNGSLMSDEDFYNSVTVHASVTNDDVIVPRQACRTLMRIVRALWSNTLRQWLLSTSTSPRQIQPRWYAKHGGQSHFTKLSNKTLNQILRKTEPTRPPAKLIKLGQHPTTICWKREYSNLKMLAPSRRDLIMRLIRNALPLGAKRIHWHTQTQTKCMLCDQEETETAEHLLWACSFAKVVWDGLHTQWRTHRRTTLTWREVLLGIEVRLDAKCNKVCDQLWSIIRACTIRVIWFERNRRFFYPNLPTRSTTFRRKQAVDDIAAHIEAWHRRSNDSEKEKLVDALTYLAQRNQIYASIRLDTNEDSLHNTYTHTT